MKMGFFAYDCFVLLFDFVALPRPNLVFYSFVCSKSPKSNTGLSILCNHSSTWLPWVDLHVNSLLWHKRKMACLQGFLVFRRPINFGKKYESRSCLVRQFLKGYIGRHSCPLSSSHLKTSHFSILIQSFPQTKILSHEFGDKVNHCKQVSCLPYEMKYWEQDERYIKEDVYGNITPL